MSRSHYDNLQVTRDATEAVIRSAYRALVNKFHPDKFDGPPEEASRITKILNEAYAVLTDPVRRREHDTWLDSQTITEPEKASSASGFATGNEVAEFVVRPRRHMAVLGLLFGFACLLMAFEAWFGQDVTWFGQGVDSGIGALLNLFFQFAAAPFGVVMIVQYGQWALTNTLFIVGMDGVRWPTKGGRLIPWGAIETLHSEDKGITISGLIDGRKWLEQVPHWLVAGKCGDIVERMVDLKDRARKR